MQNTPQTFRGTTAPGVNFSDHTYDNHIGVHCQPSGYQPYSNPPYHPIPSPRPHHYGNHQIQQSMPYRHHGGAYAPNQNQYGSGMSQEMYRNHHSGYVGANSRNMPSKPWADGNSSADLMPYGQHTSHPQVMNNPSQMPVTAMRSPPHATSNMNPTPTQGQQHYRQMQSPAHSPHSWSQAQIPSPNMMHSSRTTPSPLPAHVRSPGHSQPFSPPAAHAMNLQPHPPPPENGQIPQAMNNASGSDILKPSNPLHSLQKMVMLEQDSKSNILPRTGDGNEQYNNQCGSHSYVPEEGASNESKDSAYSTYFDLDDNCFQSKPNNTSNDASMYPAAQQVSNCSFPVPSHTVNSDMEVKNAPLSLSNNNPSITEAFHADHNSLPPPSNQASSLEQTQCSSSVPQNDCSPKLNECPPHAESAPLFTDQTKAAVSTNSEQALESSLSSNWASETAAEPHKSCLTDASNVDSADTSNSSLSEDKIVCPKPSDVPQIPSSSQVKCESSIDNENSPQKSNVHYHSLASNQIQNEISVQKPDNQICKSVDSLCNEKDIYIVNNEIRKDLKSEIADCNDDSFQNPSSLKQLSDNHDSDSELKDTNFDSNLVLQLKEDGSQEDEVKKPILRRRKVGASYEEAPSPENEHKIISMSRVENRSPKKLSKDTKADVKRSPPKSPSSSYKADEEKPAKELARNPVKVVIHRIRKSDTNDTWHVPGNNKISVHDAGQNGTNNDKISDSKTSNVGPQIIILSPAMSQKKFGFRNSGASNSLDCAQEDKPVVETVEKNGMKEKESSKSPEKTLHRINPDKKRGRPVGSKNKLKSNVVKRKKGKRGNKRKKIEMAKPKNIEVLPKPKKLKVFSGPYVHITGSKENPLSISVVNVAQKEEEKVSKVQTKRNISTTVSRIKKKQVGHLSTLSPTYDAFNRDKTWMCVFCHKGSHHGGLGDLYGPYYIKDKSLENDEKSTASSSSVSSVRGKRRKSDPEDSRSSKKSRQSSGHSSSNQSTPSGSRLQNDASLITDSSECLKEVWIHEDCAIWSQSISLFGEEVRGLEEAVTEAKENICCHCSLDGATVGCWGKSCKEQYHFSCAKETGCQMDIENFSLLCPKHQG